MYWILLRATGVSSCYMTPASVTFSPLGPSRDCPLFPSHRHWFLLCDSSIGIIASMTLYSRKVRSKFKRHGCHYCAINISQWIIIIFGHHDSLTHRMASLLHLLHRFTQLLENGTSLHNCRSPHASSDHSRVLVSLAYLIPWLLRPIRLLKTTIICRTCKVTFHIK